MTLQEILKAKGLSEEQIEATIGEMKQNKIFTTSEENLDIRYEKLKGQHDGTAKQLTEANALIEQLKKGTTDNEALQGKITEYETAMSALKAENMKLKTEGALKIALLDAGAKASDLDYLMFKAGQNGELKLGEDGKLKGQDDLVSGLKTQFPTNFNGEKQKQYQGYRIDTGDGVAGGGSVEPKSLAEALRMKYENPTE